MSDQILDRVLTLELVRVTERAAVAASYLVGRGNEKDADQAAVDAMRKELNQLDIDGEVVIGEGERDEAPMLYIGEKVGTGKGPKVDIALDPLEGTTLTAKGQADALTTIAMAEKGSLLNAPDVYMQKIAIGPGCPDNLISLEEDPDKNVTELSKALKKPIEQITVCVLDRPRHDSLIESLRSVGAKVRLIQDRDIAGVIHTTEKATGIDMYMGIGGGPEGVLAAAALSCYGGQIQTRLVLDSDESIRAKKMGITDLKKKYNIDDMIKGDVMFCATAITNGDLANGIKDQKEFYEANTIALHKDGKVNTLFKNKHKK